MLRAHERREVAFWDRQAAQRGSDELGGAPARVDADNDQPRIAALGDIRGRRLLDVGCGTGRWSVLLAEAGADVWAIDLSPKCVDVARRRAELHGVGRRVRTAVMSATATGFPDASFDLVHGMDVIHHLEGVAAFGREVARLLAPGGRAVFGENSANNPLLMFMRNRLCGRFGISKWSSEGEYPLTRQKIDEFARQFGRVTVSYPDFRFFHYLDAKLFNHRKPAFRRLCRRIDVALYRTCPALRPYSYRQLITCEK
jgi:SAM-dependent methyltransferase